MGLFKDRFDAKLEKLGKSLTLNGVTPFKAIVHILEPGIISTYFTSSEASQIVKPGLKLEAKTDLTVAINDTFPLDSRTYTVKKIAVYRIAEEAIFKILIAY